MRCSRRMSIEMRPVSNQGRVLLVAVEPPSDPVEVTIPYSLPQGLCRAQFESDAMFVPSNPHRKS